MNELCKYCGEFISMGTHSMDEKRAETCPQEECPECHQKTLAICMLGLGDFVYICKECGHKWKSNN